VEIKRRNVQHGLKRFVERSRFAGHARNPSVSVAVAVSAFRALPVVGDTERAQQSFRLVSPDPKGRTEPRKASTGWHEAAGCVFL
jgi:hypothetical protein